MMKRNALILLLFIAFCPIAFSQGYKDKRFSASYELGYSMLGRFLTWDRFVLSRHTLDASYTLSKRFSVGARFNYAKKTLPADIIAGTLGQRDFFNTFGQVNGTFKNAMIEDITFGISIRYFAKSNGCYAPIGKYFAIGYEQGRQNGTTLIVQGTSSSSDDVYSYGRENRTTLRLLSITYGRNILVYDKVLLGYGMTMSVNQLRELQLRRFIARPFVNVGFVF
jgi:hypothetical protein